jgi:hypothetical protein
MPPSFQNVLKGVFSDAGENILYQQRVQKMSGRASTTAREIDGPLPHRDACSKKVGRV